MKIAFLDRDDTIIKDYPDSQWKQEKIPEFLPQSIEALKLIQAQGFEIIIVTNQYLIDEGVITLEDYQQFDDLFQKKLKAEGIKVLKTFYCADARDSNSPNLKPAPGMIKQALTLFPNIDLTESFLVGDSLSDIGLAENMGLPIYAIKQKTDYEKLIEVENLYDAAKQVAKKECK